MIRNTPTARALLDDLINREEAAFRDGRMWKGRQLAWMVNHFFRTTPSLDMVYRVEDLSRLQCGGDKDLHNFRHRWDMITSNMADKLQDTTLENTLVSKLVPVKEMKKVL